MSDDTAAKFWGGFFIWVAIVLLTFTIACGVRTGYGRDVNNHPGPIPAGVTQLAGADFLIAQTSPELPSQLCQGTGNGVGAAPVDSTSRVPQLRGDLFVVCDTSQTFNDHRGLGHGFFHFVGPVAGDPAIELGLGGALLACLLPFGVALPRDRKRLRDRKAQAIVDADAYRAELAKAYARDEIDDAELEHGLNKVNAALLKEGVVEKKPHVPKVLRDLR